MQKTTGKLERIDDCLGSCVILAGLGSRFARVRHRLSVRHLRSHGGIRPIAWDETSASIYSGKPDPRTLAARGHALVRPPWISWRDLEMLVRAARVNERMIYHYFGSKKRLHDAILAEAYGDLAKLAAPPGPPNEEPESRLRRYIQAYFSFVQKNPEYVRLFIRENIDHGAHVKDIGETHREHPVLREVRRCLPASRQNLVEVKLLFLAIIGACQVFQSNRYTMSRWLALDLNSPETLAKASDFVPDALLHGIGQRLL